MLLFEHKQYLQSCGAESSMQTEISSFKILAVQCLQKRQVRDYNELLPGSDTTDPDKPCPREHAAKGARPCCAALEKRKRKLGVHVTIYSYESRFCLLTILMDSQVSKSLKQRFLILLLCRPALHLSLSLSLSHTHTHTLSRSLSISLALSHSDRQISSNKLFQL